MEKPLFYPKFLALFKKGYGRVELTADLFAGVTVGFIAFPVILALTIASIPQGTLTPYPVPAIGFLTAIFAGFVVSFLGGTSFQIGSPTTALIPVILLIIKEHGYLGLLAATFMAGVILVIMGVTKIGAFIKYIPCSVVSGLTTGIAVSIMVTQIGDFMGIRTIIPPPHEFLKKISWFAAHVHELHVPTFLVALVALAIIFLWPYLGLTYVPGSIVALFGMTVLLTWTGLESSLGLVTLGSKFSTIVIPSTFPSLHGLLFHSPFLHTLFKPTLSIVLLVAIESLLSAVVADELSGDCHDSNTELIAQGIANIISPFFGGLPIAGAITRTSANVTNGARSPIAGIIHTVTLLMMVLFLAPYVVYIPMAVIAAILVAVSLAMGEWHELKHLFQRPRSEALVLVTTFLLTVFFDFVTAIITGMLFVALFFACRILMRRWVRYSA